MRYDYLVVGAGLFGSVFAHEAVAKGKKVLVIDKRPHIGGNCYTHEEENIVVHDYGAHIFHTNDREVWQYMNQFAEFNRFTNMPVAKYKNKMYSLPFNMHTFYEMWGVTSDKDAEDIISQQIAVAGIVKPKNLEEQAISMVGKDIYETLVKGYTEKQWGKPCNELPPSIIKRLPVKFTWDNQYFNNTFQGVPIGGYTKIFEHLLEGSDVILNTNSCGKNDDLFDVADKIVYTGCIDEYFGYCIGKLDYRSVRFDTSVAKVNSFQGNAVINYTDAEVPFTRVIEHKYFEPREGQKNTVISFEYSEKHDERNDPCYPINDERNNELYGKYAKLAENERNVVFGGRLGLYKYIDMDVTVRKALDLAKELL